ncbi:hypothetical protein TNCV_3690821 [Trichonephila clavipes]|nr:hypothetical protein TNCV_3690821 [Trichonephila clavipes]
MVRQIKCNNRLLNKIFVIVVSFPKGRNEGCQSLRHRLDFYTTDGDTTYPPLQFRHGTRGERNVLQPPTPMVSGATTHKTFRPTGLTSTYSVGIWRVFGGIGHRT